MRTGDRIAGALCIDLKNTRLLVIHSKAVVMAAGGIGHLFRFTSYPHDIMGQGLTLAYRVGAELVDMEFMQFEPTGVYYPEKIRGLLIPTAMFGEGGILLNKYGERFVSTTPVETETKAQKHELDLLITREVINGRGLDHGGVYFDGTKISYDVLESYPLRQKRLIAAGIDLKKDFVEVGPVAHSLIGGIRIDASCQGSVEGMFAAGEVSGGVHGANRMAGNGGAETIVFGKIAGDSAGDYAAAKDFPKFSEDEIALEENRFNLMINTEHSQKTVIQEIRSEIQAVVAGAAGVIRNGKDMEIALHRLDKIKAEKLNRLAAQDLSDLIQCLEVKDMALLAEITLRAAWMRCESRGAHYRSDFPDLKDEQWLKNIIIKKGVNDSMDIQDQDVL
jgi:succinate dehydrogenase/fumarate reductase flavoprotein subunit